MLNIVKFIVKTKKFNNTVVNAGKKELRQKAIASSTLAKILSRIGAGMPPSRQLKSVYRNSLRIILWKATDRGRTASGTAASQL